MSVKISESEWKTALTSILEELDDQEYKKMLFSSYFDKIPKGVKTSKSREEMPQTIIQYLGVDESISAIKEAMLFIPRRDPAIQDKLRPFVDKLSIKCNEGSKDQLKSSRADTEKKTSSVMESCGTKYVGHIGISNHLYKGDFIISSNGKYKAVFQQDGNFVILADGDDSPIWATGTAGKNAYRITVQPDNNLVVYTEQNKPVWASDTWQHFYGYSDKMRLTMTNEGKLVLDKDGTTVWSDGKKW